MASNTSSSARPEQDSFIEEVEKELKRVNRVRLKYPTNSDIIEEAMEKNDVGRVVVWHTTRHHRHLQRVLQEQSVLVRELGLTSEQLQRLRTSLNAEIGHREQIYTFKKQWNDCVQHFEETKESIRNCERDELSQNYSEFVWPDVDTEEEEEEEEQNRKKHKLE